MGKPNHRWLERGAVASKPNGILRHPIVLMVIGAIMTSGVGGALTYFYSKAAAERERRAATQQQRYDIRLKSLHEFSKLAYERRVRAGLVFSSIERLAAADEVRERKKKYDEAYVAWGRTYSRSCSASASRWMRGSTPSSKLVSRTCSSPISARSTHA